MSVTSLEFFLFAIAVCFGLVLLRRAETPKKLLLITASLYFYATWDLRFVLILAFLTVLSHIIGLRIHAAPDAAARRRWLGGGVILGLLPLCVCKYLPVMALGLPGGGAAAASPLGLAGWLDGLVLPIGISFYTFQALSYPLDLYRGTLQRPARFLDLACFVSFFPKLLMGPIVRAGQFLPQLERPIRVADGAQAASALGLILQGLVKKLVFADVLAVHIVDIAFGDPSGHGTLFLVVAVFAYSFQIYFDLSGYTDIVRGVSRGLGLELPVNFNRPYLASSISNFWQRWHITMSSFFRDYLYFSIGGSKRGNVYFNLLVTFVAIGIWHGAGWNFVIYGAIHGALVGWERHRRGVRKARGLPDTFSGAELAGRIMLTFAIVSFARILFRAPDLAESLAYVRALANVGQLEVPVSDLGLAVLLLSFALHFTPPAWAEGLRVRFEAWPGVVQAGLAGVGVFLCLALPDAAASFIYARF